MKKRDYEMLLELQIFAEGGGEGSGAGGDAAGTGGSGTGGSGASSGDGSGAEGTGGSPGGQKGGDGKGSFDDFLSDPKNQAEFDRRVAKALSTQKEKLDGEYQTSLEDAKEEAEKLAKMNAEQKKQYEEEKKDQLIQQQKDEIDRLKKDALRAELSKEAARIMKSDHDIIATQDMLDFVVGDDSETTDANIKKLVGIIQEDRKQVEKARATGTTPRSYGGSGGGAVSEIDKRIRKYQ